VVEHYDSDEKVEESDLIVYDDLIGTTTMVRCTWLRKVEDAH